MRAFGRSLTATASRQANRWEQCRCRAIMGKGQPARRGPSLSLDAVSSSQREAAGHSGPTDSSPAGQVLASSSAYGSSSLQLQSQIDSGVCRDPQGRMDSLPITDWVRAIQHYEVAVLCGAPLRPEHAFRIAALFAQDNGTMEQFLRWWWLFRCEALPPSTAEVVALQKHQLWDQCLLTVATSDPWNPLLAREAAALFIRQSLWELSLRVLLGAPSPGKPVGWVNEGELLPQEEPLTIAAGHEDGEESVEGLLSHQPGTTFSDTKTQPRHSSASASYPSSGHGSYYQRHIPAVAAAVADAPFAVAKTVRLLCRMAEQERREGLAGKQARALEEAKRTTGKHSHHHQRPPSQAIVTEDDGGALNRFALAAALRLHSLEVLRGPDTERGVGIAARAAAAQLPLPSRPMSLTPSNPGSATPNLAPFASELQRSVSGVDLPHTWTAKSVPSSLPANVADPVVVTPTIGNILFRLAVQSEDMSSAKRFASAVVHQFGPQTLSAVTLRQYLRRLVFGSASKGGDGRGPTLSPRELDRLAESETLLTRCAERLQNSDRHWISALFEQHGMWCAALSVGGVGYVVGAADRISAHDLSTRQPNSTSSPASGDADRDSAIRMIQAALQGQYLADEGNTQGGRGSDVSITGGKDEASRLVALVTERVQLQQRLSVAALDSLAALQLQSGRWVDAIGTIHLLVAGAARLDEWRSEAGSKVRTTPKETAVLSSSSSPQPPVPLECDSRRCKENPLPIRGSNPDGSLTLLEAALLDAARSVETWRDALDLFK